LIHLDGDVEKLCGEWCVSRELVLGRGNLHGGTSAVIFILFVSGTDEVARFATVSSLVCDYYHHFKKEKKNKYVLDLSKFEEAK
jgi:hypothetical protein